MAHLHLQAMSGFVEVCEEIARTTGVEIDPRDNLGYVGRSATLLATAVLF